jgi:asparagine synthase (glutamine-hydrolysing)
MCGILGILAPAGGKAAAEALDPVELMRHRGPDSEGRYASGRVGLAMRRLSIIDLQTGDQPIFNEAGDVVCMVNGEIYNYRELRAELAARGHVFATQGDVEVVVHLYEEHGERCFEHLRGMFAVALWDDSRGRLLLVRDRLGIKPLYLADTEHGLAFASEIAPLLALGASDQLDPQAVADYLALGYVPGQATGLAGVRSLPPATALVLEDGSERQLQYWAPAPPGDVQELEQELAEAVALHLRSDVPLAVLLSGGLDSSLVAALAAERVDEPLRTFTVGFADAEYDERAHARLVAEALGTRHEELVVETDVAADLPQIVARLEEPLADAAAIPLYYLARAVVSEVKVALAGDGGDEVFGGYSRYAWDPWAGRLGRALPTRTLAGALERVPGVRQRAAGAERKDLARRAVKLLRHASLPEAERYFSWFSILGPDARAELLARKTPEPSERAFSRLFTSSAPGLSRLGRLQHVDLRSMLVDDLMLKADKLSMAHSLELRVPFLDHRVVELGLFSPDREKVQGVTTKVALRRLVERRLPRELARRPKQGFDVPIDRWLRGELKDLAGDTLGGSALDGVVDRQAARRLLDRHGAGEQDLGAQLYALVVLGLWRTALRSRGRPTVATPA